MSARQQPLFDLMSKEHGLILLESEMFEIEQVCEDISERPEEDHDGEALCLPEK